MSTPEQPFRWRSIALPAFLPTILFSIGEGAILPIIPIVADSMGAPLAVAGAVAAMVTIGHLVGDIPSGWLVARVGERPAMIGAAMLAVVAMLLAVVAPNPLILGIAVLLAGLSAAVFGLARHAFMTTFVPLQVRARALSTLGGTFRLGYFVGPLIAAGVIHLTGSPASAFWIQMAGCAGAALTLILLRDPASSFGPRTTPEPTTGGVFVHQESVGLFRTIAENRGLLARLGTGAALIGAMRTSRQVLLPLWAVSIGIGDAQTAVIIGIAGAVDFALFYTSGQIMDRWGRMWSAMPSMVGLGLGFLTLAFTHDLSNAEQWFVGVAMFLSLANGIGSGIIMTLGADLADRANPAPFLGAWRFTADAGGAAAPLIVSLFTAVASLAIASGVLGVLGLLGAGILLRYVPRYAPHTRGPRG